VRATVRRQVKADTGGRHGAVEDVAAARKAFAGTGHIVDGVVLARELVNEPPNVLYPEEFARRAGQLRKLGVMVETLDVKAMTKLGMGALLGVAQGSARPGRTVIMRWNGGKRGESPVAFVGKGVCFDTGGISIKGAANMEDMKGDMGGAACVVGLMHALAARKAKVNAVGAIGLVENMPDGNAQRPGDIVTSMSGQTIEIINTDAERLHRSRMTQRRQGILSAGRTGDEVLQRTARALRWPLSGSFYAARFTPGGFQVPSPGGRIEGGSVLGQYSRITR